MLPILASIILFLAVWLILNAAEPLVRGALPRAANLTAKFRYRDYLPVVVLVTIGGVLAAIVGDEFVDLAELVVSKSPALQNIDQTFHDWSVYARTPGDTTFFALMSTIGGPVVMGLITLAVAVGLSLRKRHRWAIYLLVTAGGGALLNLELKRFFERARPALAEMLRRASGYSFPSGHAMGSTVVMGAFAYLAVRALKTWGQKSAAIAFAVTFVAAVAASRVYLGVHWLSDIGAGISAGLLWVATTTVGYETFRRIRMIRVLREKRAMNGSTTPSSR
ncbi:MAG: phosphatase PAP2 family protein [Thermoanaerobaculia bacterium]